MKIKPNINLQRLEKFLPLKEAQSSKLHKFQYRQVTASTNGKTLGRTKREHSKANQRYRPVVSQLPTTSSNNDNLDQMSTMFTIPKEDGISVGSPRESWNLVGIYDVEEEPGNLSPFQISKVKKMAFLISIFELLM
nr:unnamed protein product [Callosobruchus analis]